MGLPICQQISFDISSLRAIKLSINLLTILIRSSRDVFFQISKLVEALSMTELILLSEANSLSK